LNAISAETKPNWRFCLLEYDSIQSAAFAKQHLRNGTIKVFDSDIIVDWADLNEEKHHNIVHGAGTQAARKTKNDSSLKVRRKFLNLYLGSKSIFVN
jgi:hypothetical protein